MFLSFFAWPKSRLTLQFRLLKPGCLKAEYKYETQFKMRQRYNFKVSGSMLNGWSIEFKAWTQQRNIDILEANCKFCHV